MRGAPLAFCVLRSCEAALTHDGASLIAVAPQISASGHVLGYAGERGAAEAAGVPVPSRVLRSAPSPHPRCRRRGWGGADAARRFRSVDGVAVRSKAQVGAALSTAVNFIHLLRQQITKQPLPAVTLAVENRDPPSPSSS
jgi:hypothetical protein